MRNWTDLLAVCHMLSINSLISHNYDLASLAYTATCLLHGCIPWSGCFPNHYTAPEDAKEMRLHVTTDALKVLFAVGGESQDVMHDLLKAIGCKEATVGTEMVQIIFPQMTITEPWI